MRTNWLVVISSSNCRLITQFLEDFTQLRIYGGHDLKTAGNVSGWRHIWHTSFRLASAMVSRNDCMQLRQASCLWLLDLQSDAFCVTVSRQMSHSFESETGVEPLVRAFRSVKSDRPKMSTPSESVLAFKTTSRPTIPRTSWASVLISNSFAFSRAETADPMGCAATLWKRNAVPRRAAETVKNEKRIVVEEMRGLGRWGIDWIEGRWECWVMRWVSSSERASRWRLLRFFGHFIRCRRSIARRA